MGKGTKRFPSIEVDEDLADEVFRICEIEGRDLPTVRRLLLVMALTAYRARGSLSCGYHPCTRKNCCQSADDLPRNIFEFDRRH